MSDPDPSSEQTTPPQIPPAIGYWRVDEKARESAIKFVFASLGGVLVGFFASLAIGGLCVMAVIFFADRFLIPALFVALAIFASIAFFSLRSLWRRRNLLKASAERPRKAYSFFSAGVLLTAALRSLYFLVVATIGLIESF